MTYIRPPEYKLIDPKDMKPGDKFEGYEGHTNSNGTHTSCLVRIEVGKNGIARKWRRNPIDMNTKIMVIKTIVGFISHTRIMILF